MIQYDPWDAPSKAEAVTAAVLAALALRLPTWTVKRRANFADLADLISAADRPTAAAPLLVLTRGPRRQAREDTAKGTTRKLWDLTLIAAVVVWDQNADTRATTLDAAEVLVANAINRLDAETDFGAMAEAVSFQGFDPVTVQTQGDAPPHAASAATLLVTTYE